MASNKNTKSSGRIETLVQHAGQGPEVWCTDSSVVPPIVTATTFRLPEVGVRGEYVYARWGNPTRNSFETCIAALEGAKHGIAFSSGVTTLYCVTNLLNAGDHIISGNEIYGGCMDQMREITSRMDIETTFVDTRDPQNVADAIKPNTRMIWLETPTNPGLRISDIKAIADIVHKHDNIFLCVDNTFSSPCFQQPLKLGADMVMASVTKYINGHSDVLMGIVCTNRDDMNERLRRFQQIIGAVPSPFDCYLANRGVKTLPLRMEKHQQNATAVAKALERNPRVEKVLYPGLESHPQHELAARQMSGFSGMVTMWFRGGMKEAKIFFDELKVFTNAASLGGTHSLCEHPATLTHDGLSPEERANLGMHDNMVRISVGLEHEDDLIEDLEQALKAAIPDV